MKPQPLPWCEPLALAAALHAPTMVLLHSSAHTHYSGDHSVLAVDVLETIDVQDFSTLDKILHSHHTRYDHAWFGYLGYELKHDCEPYAATSSGRFALPRGRLMRFGRVYVFDHKLRTLTLWANKATPLPGLAPLPAYHPPAVVALSSNMSRADYQAKVSHILTHIRQGDLYQANLTRKFYGEWEHHADALKLFSRMCSYTPAPYSALIRMNGVDILSSSPELFLRVSHSGMVETRPIKGSIARGATLEEDERNRLALENSDKNRAENLMIVDLMRNDLARACEPSSVEISKLFDVNTHATIHHMASSITGRLKADATRSSLIRGCFPPGSMTGAPKIRAVELCNTLEGIERGVYSGALGWFGGDGSLELSVVIRTLIMQHNHFEFQVGGGIVADSTPEDEWAETMEKTVGLCRTLGIPREQIEKL